MTPAPDGCSRRVGAGKSQRPDAVNLQRRTSYASVGAAETAAGDRPDDERRNGKWRHRGSGRVSDGGKTNPMHVEPRTQFSQRTLVDVLNRAFADSMLRGEGLNDPFPAGRITETLGFEDVLL